MNKIENINFILFNIGLFSFLFLWDLKFNNFQFRYLIILPILCLIFNPKIYNIRSIFKILIIPNLILIHFLYISITNNYSIEIRDILGLIFLYIIFFVTIHNFEKFEESLEKVIDIFTILFSVAFLTYFIHSKSILNLDCYDGWFFNHKFIFVENSHFSLISVSIINYYIYKFCQNPPYKNYDYIKIFFFIIFFIISILNFSTTFLVGLILTQTYILIKNLNNKKIIMSSLILIIISSTILLNYKQCTERSLGSIQPIYKIFVFKNEFKNKSLEQQKNILSNNDYRINMSVETFLVSLEISYNSILDNLLGVGFNKYQIAHKNYIDKIVKIDDAIKKNNIYDGSTNISKITTEYGIFGIIFILFFLFSLFKRRKFNQFDIFLISLICLQFLRGVGYFNGGFLLIFLVYFYKLHREGWKFK